MAQDQLQGLKLDFKTVYNLSFDNYEVPDGILGPGAGMGLGIGPAFHFGNGFSTDLHYTFLLNAHYYNDNGWVGWDYYNKSVFDLNGRYTLKFGQSDYGVRLGAGPGLLLPSKLRFYSDLDDVDLTGFMSGGIGYQASIDLFYQFGPKGSFFAGFQWQDYGMIKMKKIENNGTGPPQAVFDPLSSRAVQIRVGLTLF